LVHLPRVTQTRYVGHGNHPSAQLVVITSLNVGVFKVPEFHAPSVILRTDFRAGLQHWHRYRLSCPTDEPIINAQRSFRNSESNLAWDSLSPDGPLAAEWRLAPFRVRRARCGRGDGAWPG